MIPPSLAIDPMTGSCESALRFRYSHSHVCGNECNANDRIRCYVCKAEREVNHVFDQRPFCQGAESSGGSSNPSRSCELCPVLTLDPSVSSVYRAATEAALLSETIAFRESGLS